MSIHDGEGGPMEHLPAEVMRLRDHILNFKHLKGEPFHESWLQFKTLLMQCPTHELPNLVLLECFYRGLSPRNREIMNQLMPSGCEKYPYETAVKFLDLVAKTNKDGEKDQQLTIWLGQMNSLTQKVEELEVMSKSKSKYLSSTEQGRCMDIENRRINDTLLTILQKLNKHDKVLEEIRENVEMLNQRSGSHFRSIQLIETLLNLALPQLHPYEQAGSPSYTRLKLGKCLKRCMKASNRFSWRVVDKFSELKYFCDLTEGILRWDSVKLSGLERVLAHRQPCWRFRQRPPLGSLHKPKVLLTLVKKLDIRRVTK
uniref:Retrotransposon gag protein n=1 Tax=Solanum tuberosum TaxID=4113 RepID=M1DZ39_SOLTU